MVGTDALIVACRNSDIPISCPQRAHCSSAFV